MKSKNIYTMNRGSRSVVSTTLATAYIQHIMSIYSAYIGTSRKAGGTLLRFAAMMCLLFSLGVGNAWGAVNNGDLFERISAAPAANDEVIFVNQAETHACGTTQNTNNRAVVSISTSSHQYIYASSNNVQVFTVKKNSTNFGFHTGTGYIYSASNSNNYLKTNSTAASTSPSGTSAWSCPTVSSSVFTFKNASNTSYYLQFNGTSYFSQYKNTQTNPYLYKKVMSAPTAVAASSITSSGATITITDGTNVNNYELYYGTSSTAPTASSTATTTITSGKSKSITGLTASTRYYVWARAFSTSPARKTGWVALTGTSFTTSALPTTLSASPNSITFAANTLSGGEAAGSTTINISVSNGYKSSGNYLNIWPETDETSCEFYVNSGNYIYSSGNSTSVSSLSVEYYAIEAGTFTGNLIAEGYNSSYEAVNCTIPLSITVSAPACANSVTISKGTGTNCTFTLSKSGAQASCDGVSTTVTVSPNTGYGNPSVTQTGASAEPTITGSSNTYTVAYGANTTGTSTINVSCSANNYTINLNTDLTPTSAGTTSITATYNANTNLTSAITKPTKTGWTFGGYFTAKNGGGTQIIDASGNVIANVATYTDSNKKWIKASDVTLYAKWTCTVTWSVNGATDVYDAQTLTYNGTSTKVGSVPGPPSPASYCGQKFAGWTDAAIDGTQDAAPSTLFTTVAGSPELKTVGNKTFYAVFADYDE